ncbi:MAG: aminotransferase class V-fold PLP-dependent enzyme [Chloroflexota bacterium]
MSVLEQLGVRPIINAAGPVTRLGGHRIRSEVAEAMAQAAQSHARIEDLQARASALLSEATGAEAGLVTSGAAGALFLASAACLAGFDLARMDALPAIGDGRAEIVVQRGHRNAYDHAIRAAGARFVEAGYLGHPGAGCTHPWQIEAAVTDRTVALAWPVMSTPGTVDLSTVSAIAHARGLPVIVDAAAALPPRSNLRRFIAEGADLVAYSGGKAIGGPQASGLLVGRRDLIQSATLQMLDMDVYREVWEPGKPLMEDGRIPGPPHHGIGRQCKVGKEQIVGLLTALRLFLAEDETIERQRWLARLETIQASLRGVPGLDVAIRSSAAVPTCVVSVDRELVGMTAYDVIQALEAGDPPVCVSQGLAAEGGLVINPTTLTDA